MSDFAKSLLNVLNTSHSISELQKQNELIVDEEFANLIPPLTPDEFSGLTQSILSEGCREPLIVWNSIIIDGHNRYKICTEHNVPFKTIQKDFTDRNEVMLWMLQNQLSRRNLNDFQRVEMVRKYENAVKAQAEKRMLTGKADPSPKLGKGRATDELGTLAGVSHNTYEHAIAVLDNAPKPVIDATRKKELSINAAYEVTKMDSDKQQEISERISSGEKPSKVISEVKKKPDALDYWRNVIKHAEKAVKDGHDIDAILKLVKKAVKILETRSR